MFYLQLFFPEDRGVYEIMSKKFCTSGQATDENRTRRMRIACWIPKAINICSEYAVIIAFLWQQWLLDRASVVRYGTMPIN